MALLEMTYFSKELRKTTRMNVILPEDPQGKLKTLWLLHGWSEDSSAWQRFSGIERFVERRDIAVIMPDGALSFYNDMAHGPAYFTHITKELPQMVAKMFGLSTAREDNFIAGLSMGGYGSLKLGLSCPEQYAGIGCFSASNFVAGFSNPDSSLRMKDPLWLGWMDNIFGEEFNHLMGSRQDVYHLADEILANGKPCPKIYHCIGTEDGGYQSALETKAFFESKEGNPFDYKYEEGPGVHDWHFWDAHIASCLKHFGLL